MGVFSPDLRANKQTAFDAVGRHLFWLLCAGWAFLHWICFFWTANFRFCMLWVHFAWALGKYSGRRNECGDPTAGTTSPNRESARGKGRAGEAQKEVIHGRILRFLRHTKVRSSNSW